MRIKFFLIYFLFLINVQESFSQIPEKLNTLPGRWMMKTDKGNLYEYWESNENEHLSGGSYIVDTINKDTIPVEFLDINTIRDFGLIYTATLLNDSGGSPVYFKFTGELNNVFTFENPEHDYPQKIIYDLSVPDSLNARIEGKEKGIFKAFDFKFKRVTE